MTFTEPDTGCEYTNGTAATDVYSNGSNGVIAAMKSALQSPHIPRWEQERTEMTNLFPAFDNNKPDTFRSEMDSALSKLERLRPEDEDSPVFLGGKTPFRPRDDLVGAEMQSDGVPLESVMTDLVGLFEGLNNPANPQFNYNIICHPTKASIVAATLANYISPNFISGHSAWNTTNAETECAAKIGNLVQGWENGQSGGFFTYGGAGCYLYGLKYALNSVYKQFDIRKTGVIPGGKIICSRNGHHANEISTEWLGMGSDNIVLVDTDPETCEMDMGHLERLLQGFQKEGCPVVSIVCTMCTTDEMAIDPVDEVAALIEKYPNPEGYGRTHIYCDSVAGWVFLMFKDYDFDANELQFSSKVNETLRIATAKIALLRHADSFALDFHKTGFCNYTTSMCMVKDMQNFEHVMSRGTSHIIHKRTVYNPGQYTLEVSRSAAPALSAWANLKLFGTRGYQTLIGGVVEHGAYLSSLLEKEDSIVFCSKNGSGLNTAVRIYEEGVNAREQFDRELTDGSPEMRATLKKNNDLQNQIANRIWEHSRNGTKVAGDHVMLINFSACFSRTKYFHDDIEEGDGITYALKVFPFNINVTRKHMDRVVVCLKAVRDEVLAEMNS